MFNAWLGQMTHITCSGMDQQGKSKSNCKKILFIVGTLYIVNTPIEIRLFHNQGAM